MQKTFSVIILCCVIFLFGNLAQPVAASESTTSEKHLQVYSEILSNLNYARGRAHALAYEMKTIFLDDITGTGSFRPRLNQCKKIYTRAKIVQDQIISNIIDHIEVHLHAGLSVVNAQKTEMPQEFVELEKCREDVYSHYQRNIDTDFNRFLEGFGKVAPLFPALELVIAAIDAYNTYIATSGLSASTPPPGYVEKLKNTYWLDIDNPARHFLQIGIGII